MLSHFNFADGIHDSCLLSVDPYRIQSIWNGYMRLNGGIRSRLGGIAAKLREIKWVIMNKRRVLHSLVLFNTIIVMKHSNYLLHEIKFRHDQHNLEIRQKFNISTPVHFAVHFVVRHLSYTRNAAKL